MALQPQMRMADSISGSDTATSRRLIWWRMRTERDRGSGLLALRRGDVADVLDHLLPFRSEGPVDELLHMSHGGAMGVEVERPRDRIGTVERRRQRRRNARLPL